MPRKEKNLTTERACERKVKHPRLTESKQRQNRDKTVEMREKEQRKNEQMIPTGMTLKQAIMYSTLPSGYANQISIRNALLGVPTTTVRRWIQSLVDSDCLKERVFTLLDKEKRRHVQKYYTVTEKGVAEYLPILTQRAGIALQWNACYPDLQFPYEIPAKNGNNHERHLRVVETEQFCSRAGVLTLMDRRPSCLNAVYGCSAYSAVNSSHIEMGLSEAIESAKPNEKMNGDMKETPYVFYRSQEVTSSAEGQKDPATIVSPFIGIVANKSRVFVLYRTARFGGVGWDVESERKVNSYISFFCSKLPGSEMSSLKPAEDAILFYQSDRELNSFITGVGLTSPIHYDVFCAPYRRMIAIPYSIEGMRTFQAILREPDFCGSEIERIFDVVGILAEGDGDQDAMYQFELYEKPTVCAAPLNLVRLSRYIELPSEVREGTQIITYPRHEAMLTKLLPQTPIIEISSE